MKAFKVLIPDHLMQKLQKRKDKKEIDKSVQIRTALHHYFKKLESE